MVGFEAKRIQLCSEFRIQLHIFRHILYCCLRIAYLRDFCDCSTKVPALLFRLEFLLYTVLLLTTKNHLLNCFYVVFQRNKSLLFSILGAEVSVQCLCLWSDSQVLQYWLKQAGKKLKDCIQKRVTHILKIAKTNRCFYLATHYKS